MAQEKRALGAEILLRLSHKHDGKWDKIIADVRSKAAIDLSQPAGYDLFGWEPVTILDEGYPEKLKNAIQPPFVLFAKGDLSILSQDLLLLICPSRYTFESRVGAMLGLMRDERLPVIIDWHDPDASAAGNGTALEALRAYQNSGVPFAVVIPASAKDRETLGDEIAASGGLALCEAFPGCDRRPDPAFGRIGAHLAKAALVLGGEPNSPAAMETTFALSAGIDVGALAWGALNPSGRFCQELVRNGAELIASVEHAKALLGRES